MGWRKMYEDLPKPVGEKNQNDDDPDLDDSALFQLWRLRHFIACWRFPSHRPIALATISQLAGQVVSVISGLHSERSDRGANRRTCRAKGAIDGPMGSKNLFPNFGTLSGKPI